MRIDERLADGNEPSFSFEFFPPKTDEGERNLGRALAELSRLAPTFVSVTYGAAGGTTQKRKTIDIVRYLKRDYGMEAMAHFTCVGADVDELRQMLGLIRDAGIANVLALRGDPPQGQSTFVKTEGGFSNADELVKLVAKRQNMMRDAWLTATKHLRPGLPAGLPLIEAQAKSDEMMRDIENLMKKNQ